MKLVKTYGIVLIGLLLILSSGCRDRFEIDERAEGDLMLVNDYCQTNINVPLNVHFLDNDVIEGDYTVSLNDPVKGRINTVEGQQYIVYTPEVDATGLDRFTYSVCVGEDCRTAEIEVYISEISLCDQKFIAQEDNIFPRSNKAFISTISRFTKNDFTCLTDRVDPDYFKIISMPKYGTLKIDVSEDYFEYIPENGFEGVDILEYEVASQTHPNTKSRAKVNIGVSQSRFFND